MSDEFETDEIGRLLSPTVRPSDALLQARLRLETTRLVRRRRQLRRLGQAAALAACYAAGLATVWLLRSTPSPTNSGATPPAMAKFDPQPPLETPEATPAQLELLAEQTDGVESARLYLTAGRRYGREQSNWPAALRCYRNALDANPELADESDPMNDDALIISLRKARKQERGHASDLD